MIAHSIIVIVCMLILVGLLLYDRRLKRLGQMTRRSGTILRLIGTLTLVVLSVLLGIDIAHLRS